MFDDKSYVKFRILPTCSREYHLGFKCGSKCHRQIVAEWGEALPFKRSVIVPKSSFEYYIAHVDPIVDETFYIDWFSLKENAHRHKLVLKVDEGNLPSYRVKELILDNVKNLPEKLSPDLKEIPVIAFYDNSSVICVWKRIEESGYQFLEGWNGMYGKQLLIAFDEITPKLCDEAAESHQRRPSFVVSDLINIMSQSPEEKINNLHVKVTNDSKNPVLIEFENYDGIKKEATPAFLMAMLLKEHLNAIKEETDLKVTELGFYFITQTQEEKISRIKKHLEESCEMLKIGCCFVNS
uniref:Uncharacterized protein n=1 Tax=Panagrolaimus sp. ES5 TaxID=591445 RepID=A0AC34EZZ9_9BILA